MMDDMSLSPEFIWDEDAQQFDLQLHGCALLLGVEVAHYGTPQAHHVAVMQCDDNETARIVQLAEMLDIPQQPNIWHAVTLLRHQHYDKPDAVRVEVNNIRQVVRNAIASYEKGEHHD